MFTGIVQQLGRIKAFTPTPFGAALSVDSCGWSQRPSIGDSIAVNGCCLTVARQDQRPDELHFDIIHQTLDVTTLGRLKADDPVNLEHAVSASTPLGGHIVQGHIDGIGVISRMLRDPAQCRMQVTPNDRALMRCIVEKGSIAVDGVSLTVAATGEDWFETALIPTTLKMTNLGTRAQGIPVNLETDYLAKVIVNYLERTQSR